MEKLEVITMLNGKKKLLKFARWPVAGETVLYEDQTYTVKNVQHNGKSGDLYIDIGEGLYEPRKSPRLKDIL